jgi:hypothetical protein
MTERIDYLIKDNQCEKAIEDFKTLSSVPDWLEQYSDLFDSVSIQPKGLPRITSSHFEGESFENIQLFAHLYDLVNSLFK